MMLLNVTGNAAQRRRLYNGLIDKAVELEGAQQLHLVYLHGEVTKPDHGFILTEAEYWAAIKSEKHYWYQRAAQDYFAYCPVFIGSSLDEPVLAAELERVRRDSRFGSGRAFLVTPDVLTPIKKSSLKARGIVHLQGTLKTLQIFYNTNYLADGPRKML
jgi:SIR2-like domain